MKARSLLTVAAGLGLLVVGILWLSHSPAGNPDTSATTAAQVSSPALGAREVEPPTDHAPGPQAGQKKRDNARQARETLAGAIARARATREASNKDASRNHANGTSSESPPRPLDIANKTGSNTEWEQRQLQTLNELLGECYDLAAHDQPGLEGTIGITFTVAAEPEVGGLVDNVEFMGEYSSIDHPGMRECMHESMYALELDPPPEGIEVERQITLRFDAEDSD